MVFFGPLLVLMVGLLAFPILFALYASFADVNNLFSLKFAGLTNYESLLARPETLSGPLVNTLRFTLGSVVLALTLGFGAALLLNGRLAGRRVMRSAFMFPWVIPTVVTALLWRWIMDSNAGAFNGLLLQLRIIDQPVSWLGEPQLAPWIIILAQVWRGFPFIMVMLLAAMQTIPAELHEAAAVDGAGPLRRLVSITWPGVRPIFILVGTLEGLYAFREFAMIDVVTGGGPAGATEVLATQVYRLFFQYHRFGDAMALAALMFVLALIATLFLMRMAARGEED
ncbi:carbohydrate ABC transporter permease [Polymorphospora lycopeni]|uniref:Sugar ABC transporter permease n=1 Tax=Polymorphospora lycopeni TaxID=3140240 RepID=A0ABV5CZL5_9ACTN